MKTPILSVLVLIGALFAFGATPLFAANKEYRAYAFNISSVENDRGVQVEIGTSEAALIHALGWPDRKLSSDVWLYVGYRSPNLTLTRGYGCDRLLVTVSGRAVRDIKLVNPRGERAVMAQFRSGAVGVCYTKDDRWMNAVEGALQ